MSSVRVNRIVGRALPYTSVASDATGFSYVFCAIGGDDVVTEVLTKIGIDTKWEILMFVMALIFLLGFPF